MHDLGFCGFASSQAVLFGLQMPSDVPRRGIFCTFVRKKRQHAAAGPNEGCRNRNMSQGKSDLHLTHDAQRIATKRKQARRVGYLEPSSTHNVGKRWGRAAGVPIGQFFNSMTRKQPRQWDAMRIFMFLPTDALLRSFMRRRVRLPLRKWIPNMRRGCTEMIRCSPFGGEGRLFQSRLSSPCKCALQLMRLHPTCRNARSTGLRKHRRHQSHRRH